MADGVADGVADGATPGLDVRGLSQAILEIHRAARDYSFSVFQPFALDQLQRLIPFDSAWWGNAAADPPEIHRLHLHNCDASILEAYTPYIAQDFFRAALVANPGRTINMSDLTTRAAFVRTPIYRGVGKRYKIEWSLGTLLVEPISSLQEFLTLWRHDPKKPFCEAERLTKELLMPHIADAHRDARLREIVGIRKSPLDCWAVTDERGYLREAHPTFIHWLRACWPGWRGSRLPDALHASVRRAESFSAGGLKLRIERHGAFRLLKSMPANPLDRLTAREREVVVLYAKGADYTMIATSLRLAPATVRNHIAHCYRKLSVNNKAELVRRVMQHISW